jgi:hypothetical protein
MSFIDHYELTLAERVAAGDVVPVPLFPIGEWTSAKYPKLSLTQALADELIANFEAGILGTEPVLDSSGKHDTSAPAAGWFKKLYTKPMHDGGDMLLGDCELTELGAQQLNEGLYKYDSVEIDSVVLNDSGERVPNVFKSATLTNTPVLRMLPAVLEVGESVALAEAIEVALSEVVLAEPKDDEEDPVKCILDDMDALASKLDGALKGKRGMPAVRAFLKEVRAKAAAHSLSEDDGSPVENNEADSDGGSPDAKADEGQTVTLAEGDAAPKGCDPSMNETIIKALKLAEESDEEAVEAAVVKLVEERDSARTQLADTEKAKRDAEIEATLTALIEGGHVLPGQKDVWIKLAEDAPESFTAMAEERKSVKAIELGEVGQGGIPVEEPEDANLALAQLSEKIAEERKLELGEAMSVALAERPDLASRLYVH